MISGLLYSYLNKLCSTMNVFRLSDENINLPNRLNDKQPMVCFCRACRRHKNKNIVGLTQIQ